MTSPAEYVRAEAARYVADLLERTAPAELPVRERVKRTRTPARGPSTVFSFRLDHDEVAALERRAEAAGIGPSVLARNLVRVGLATRPGDELPGALDRLAVALDEVRRLMH
jgi:predicted transcriptional regulator